MEQSVKDTLEDAGIGAANVLAWLSDNFNGILVAILTAIYFYYKINKERHAAEKERIEKDMRKAQFDKWVEITDDIKDKNDKRNV